MTDSGGDLRPRTDIERQAALRIPHAAQKAGLIVADGDGHGQALAEAGGLSHGRGQTSGPLAGHAHRREDVRGQANPSQQFLIPAAVDDVHDAGAAPVGRVAARTVSGQQRHYRVRDETSVGRWRRELPMLLEPVQGGAQIPRGGQAAHAFKSLVAARRAHKAFEVRLLPLAHWL